MPFANLPDLKLHYEISGPEGAPVVVFSNGLGTTIEMWEPQVALFRKQFRVLRLDTRGHGKSGLTPGPYTMGQLALDVVHLLNALEIGKAHFCGLSLGGMIGLFLGIHAPERFHKLVLCNTAAKIGTNESWNTRIETVQNGGMKAVSKAVFERWLTADYRTSHVVEAERMLAMLEAADTEGYMACCGALRDADFRNDLGKIPLPSLAVAGTHDPTSPPKELQFLANRIPGAKYVELSAAHLSNVEAADGFNRHVVEFLLA